MAVKLIILLLSREEALPIEVELWATSTNSIPLSREPQVQFWHPVHKCSKRSRIGFKNCRGHHFIRSLVIKDLADSLNIRRKLGKCRIVARVKPLASSRAITVTYSALISTNLRTCLRTFPRKTWKRRSRAKSWLSRSKGQRELRTFLIENMPRKVEASTSKLGLQ